LVEISPHQQWYLHRPEIPRAHPIQGDVLPLRPIRDIDIVVPSAVTDRDHQYFRSGIHSGNGLYTRKQFMPERYLACRGQFQR
jgi:hypothetical protein